MKIVFSESFQHDLARLPNERRGALIDLILAIPSAFREPHRHTGVGLRKLHVSGIWEVRLGRDLRVVLGLRSDQVVLDRIADHDTVRQYLKSL